MPISPRGSDPRVLVTRMAEPGIELALGLSNDPQFGPVVMVGAGGVLIEMLRDARHARWRPSVPATARRLIDGLALRPLLDGVRGRRRRMSRRCRGDRPLLRAGRGSRRASSPRSTSIPLIVGPDGAGRRRRAGHFRERSETRMDLTLPPKRTSRSSAQAKAFAETILFPHEEELELNGRCRRRHSPDPQARWSSTASTASTIPARTAARGSRIFQQMLVNEELGKATGALWAIVWHPAVPLRCGTEEQRREYLMPELPGKRRGCLSPSPSPAQGSDPRLVQTRADRRRRQILSHRREVVRHHRRPRRLSDRPRARRRRSRQADAVHRRQGSARACA